MYPFPYLSFNGHQLCAWAINPLTYYKAFSLTWLASMQIYWSKRKRLHKKGVQLPHEWFGTPTWPPFHCFNWDTSMAAVTSFENTL